jgi:hypothetical protein
MIVHGGLQAILARDASKVETVAENHCFILSPESLVRCPS